MEKAGWQPNQQPIRCAALPPYAFGVRFRCTIACGCILPPKPRIALALRRRASGGRGPGAMRLKIRIDVTRETTPITWTPSRLNSARWAEVILAARANLLAE